MASLKAGSASNVRSGADRFDQDKLGRPIWDRIYRSVWGDDIIIERDLGEIYEYFAVDVRITKPKRLFPLYGQEKSLGFFQGSIRGFNTLTIEFMQNPDEDEIGDAFRINAGFYACAYLNKEETDFTHGGIVNWPALVLPTWSDKLIWRENRNKDGHARASFKYVEFKDVPIECLILLIDS